jgi:hypothetical protein
MTDNQKKIKTTTGRKPVKIIAVSRYCGTKSMSEMFENIIAENIKRNLGKIS